MVRKGRLNSNPFESQSGGTTTLIGTDGNLYGMESVDEGRMSVRLVNIFQIHPDPTQPRRAMPSTVRQHWDEHPNTVANILSLWLQMVEQERGSAFDLDSYLGPDANTDIVSAFDEVEPTYGPQEGALLPIVRLAASIKRDGLVNPITVVGQNAPHQLETGERRWLAYHLLYAYSDDRDKDKWARISANVVSDFNRFRQIAENTVRQDLNAIGRARQYALTLMALNSDYEPLPYTTDHAYYAQALELSTPYGQRDKLLAALGVASGSALDRYKQLLRLDESLWIKGDDENLSERQLLLMQQQLDEPEIARTQEKRPAFEHRLDKLVGTIQRAKRQDRIRLIDQAISELERLKQNLE